MKAWLVALFFVVPLVEFSIVVWVATNVGVWPTLAVLIADSLIGAFLVRREGMGAWRRITEHLRQAKMPTNSLIDGVLIIAAGAFMLTPGFLTDVVGLLMLIPFTRAPIRSMIRKRVASSVRIGTASTGGPASGAFFGPGASGPGSGAGFGQGHGFGGPFQTGFNRHEDRGDVIDAEVVEDDFEERSLER